MRVSIIVPVYNVSAYIERCIKSVMCQSFKDSMECIIVDDCTPDDSIEKCETLISAYDGPVTFLILHHEKNRGLSAARNTGTMAAKGKYIYYLDSDDELVPESIELLYAQVKKYPDVEMVQGNVKSVPDQAYYDMSFLNEVNYIEDNNWIRYHYYKLYEKLPTTAWNKLLLKEFILKNALFFKEGLIHEDELWMFLVVKYMSNYSVVHDITYIHYETLNSIMTTESKEKNAHHWGIILDEVLKRLDTPYKDLQLLTYSQRLVWAYGICQSDKSYFSLKNRFVVALIKNKLYSVAFLLWLHFFFFSKFNNTFFYPRFYRNIQKRGKSIYEQ